MIATALVMGRWVLLALAATALTSGCNLIVDADRKQCAKDDDCTKRGPAFQGTVCVNSMCEPAPPPPSELWGCLDGPPPDPVSPNVYNVTMHAQSIADSKPIEGVAAKLCRRLNPECMPPEATGVTDANGDVTFQVPSNLTGPFVAFDKFDETLPPEQRDNEWVPANYFFNPNVTSDMTISVQMATFRLRNILTVLLQKPQADDRGLILINVLSCTGAGAPGVTFKADRTDDTTVPFYVVGGVPNASLTATNTDGFGGFVNIPTGLVAVTGEIQETGRTIDTVSFPVFPNAITYSRLVARGQPPSPQ